ncbi:MAG: NAD(P)/FAD-dependent oxidoreductase [candidate division Zixibacteria bacterium]
MKIEDVIIIGAGPAGIAAAIQLRRYGIKPLIFEKDRIGGLLKNADMVENYPGFPDGISGRELITALEKHLGNSNHIYFEDMIELDFEDNLFTVISTGRKIQSRIIIVASGTVPIDFSDITIPDESKDRILYEIHTILEENGKKITIVGAGDAAFDYALNLGRNNKIVILNRSDRTNFLPLLRERAADEDNIEYLDNARVISVKNNPDDQLSICYRRDGKEKELRADYLVFAIGRKPATGFFSDRLNDNKDRLLKDGLLYMIGDVNNGLYRQTAIATGNGIKAAMKTAAKLKGN